MRISTKVNLAALKNAAIIKSGKNKDVDCIIIPILQNKLFKSEKGAVYLDLVGFELKNKREGIKDTHMVKQSFSKDEQAKMTEEEIKALPILGNHIVWGNEPQAQTQTEATIKEVADDSDLPF